MSDKSEYLKRLKELHLRKSGVILNKTQLTDTFEALIALVEAIYKPIPHPSHGFPE